MSKFGTPFSHHLLEPLVKIIFNLFPVWGPIYEETRKIICFSKMHEKHLWKNDILVELQVTSMQFY